MQSSPINERLVVFLLAMVQFINILEFVIVMPLGPDFATALNIPLSDIGYIGASYTLAAAISGVIAAFFIDKFDRKKALLVVMLALLIATGAAAFANSFSSLLLARLVAGFFGGQATALALAIIADLIPIERRGRALSSVMSAFAVASVVGVPAGLELAHRFSWRAPFFAIVILGSLVLGLAWHFLPALTIHLQKSTGIAPEKVLKSFKHLLNDPAVLVSFLLAVSVTMGLFLIIPNIAPYLIANLHYPRESIGFLYFVGGICTFASNYSVGRFVDRFGSMKAASFGAVYFASIIFLMFVYTDFAREWVVLLFAAFMVGTSIRGVSYQTVVSMVPRPHERGRFMSLQSSVQHLSSACGAFLGSLILAEGTAGKLLHVNRVAYVAIVLSLTTPILIFWILRLVKKRSITGIDLLSA